MAKPQLRHPVATPTPARSRFLDAPPCQDVGGFHGSWMANIYGSSYGKCMVNVGEYYGNIYVWYWWILWEYIYIYIWKFFLKFSALPLTGCWTRIPPWLREFKDVLKGLRLLSRKIIPRYRRVWKWGTPPIMINYGNWMGKVLINH